MINSIMTVQDLSVRYDQHDVIAGISFAFGDGKWIGICGANGAGKTTLVKALGGLLPPSGGGIFLSGGAAPAAQKDLRDVVSLAVPTSELPDTLRVGDVLNILNGPDATNRENDMARAILDHLELIKVESQLLGSLSSGWRQRLSIYSAFCPARKIVILDEPFNWLDPITSARLRGVLREFVADGLCLVTCEHDLGMLAQRCDRAICLAEGKVVAEFNELQLRHARNDVDRFEADVIALMARR